MMTHPKFLRLIFRFLRPTRPIAIIGKKIVVTRHEDVKDVLDRSDDFILAEFSEQRMLMGDFLLNNDWPEQHVREEGSITGAMRKEDKGRIRSIAAASCDDYIGDQSKAQVIDVVELAKRVATDVIEKYFGVRAPDNKEEEFIGWLTQLAGAILALPPQGSRAYDKVEQAADELSKYLEEYIAKITAKLRNPSAKCDDTVLERLIELQIQSQQNTRENRQTPDRIDLTNWQTSDWVRRMIAGLIIFGSATIVRTATDSIYEIITRKNILDNACEASRNLTTCSSNEGAAYDSKWESVRIYIYEALRFRPMLPLLFRYSPRATTIADSKSRGRRISFGATVIAPPLAAMFDPRVFPKPGRFMTDRPIENYLLFGTGMHRCVGQHIADIELVEIVSAILSLPKIRRPASRDKRLRYEGVAAKKLLLNFGDL